MRGITKTLSAKGQRKIIDFLLGSKYDRKPPISEASFIINAIIITNPIMENIFSVIMDHVYCYEKVGKIDTTRLRKHLGDSFYQYKKYVFSVADKKPDFLSETDCDLCEIFEGSRRIVYDLLSFVFNRKILANIIRDLLHDYSNDDFNVRLISKDNIMYYLEWEYNDYKGYIYPQIRYSDIIEDRLLLVLDYKVSVLVDDKLLSLRVIDGKTADEIRKEAANLILKLLYRVSDYLAKRYELKNSIVHEKILNSLNLVMDPGITVPPKVKLLFGNGETSDKVTDILKYGPYNISCGNINLYTIYYGSDQELFESFKKEFIDYVGKRYGKNLEIRTFPIVLSKYGVLLDQLKQYGIGSKNIEACSVYVALQGDDDSGWYDYIKALTFKPHFYFMSQIVTRETIEKLRKSRYPIAANLMNSIIFRAGGTPYIALVGDKESRDLMSSRLAIGIGFSRSKRVPKGFTFASVAIVDIYGGHVSVDTLYVRKGGGPLRLRREEIAPIVNKVKELVENYDYSELAIYVSKRLDEEEATALYEILSKEFGNTNIIVLSTGIAGFKTLHRRINSLVVPLKTTNGALILQWTIGHQEKPLQLHINEYSHYSADIVRETNIMNILRYLYYPGSVEYKRIAPIIYAKKVAKIAPIINNLRKINE